MIFFIIRPLDRILKQKTLYITEEIFTFNDFKPNKIRYPSHFWSDKGLKKSLVNLTCLFLIAGLFKVTTTLPLSLVISENLSMSILYICERNAGKLRRIQLPSSPTAVYSTARVCSLWARVCTVQGLPQLVQV